MNLVKTLRQWNKDRLSRRRQAHQASYPDWIRRHDDFDIEKLGLSSAQRGPLIHGDLISIIVVLDRPGDPHLGREIASVKRQICQSWELIIAPTPDIDDATKTTIRNIASTDARIKFLDDPRPGSRAQAFSAAIGQSSGHYIAILGQGDEIPAHALLMVRKAIQRQPNAALLYTDEDRIDEGGERSNPMFKPDWNAYLARSQPYARNFLVFKQSLAGALGDVEEAPEHAERYHVMLKASEQVAPSDIIHIPFILYHERLRPPGPAERNAHQAVQAHLDRLGIRAQALDMEGKLRVVYRLPEPAPKVSIIIPSRDRPELLKQCVDSIFEKTDYPDFEIVFVDNGTRDPEALRWIDHARGRPNFKLIRDQGPFNYSRLNNRAAKECGGAYICLMNNDVEVTDAGWLTEMVSLASQADVGIVGARLLYPSTQLQHAGVILGVGGVAGHAFKNSARDDPGHMGRAMSVQEYSAVTAACLLTSKAIYEGVGGLDEQALAVALNDVDYCLKVRSLGLKVVYTPHAEHIHHESASRGDEKSPEKKARFHQEREHMKTKWRDWLRHDPAYNPNLTLKFEDFSLASPPRIDFKTYLHG